MENVAETSLITALNRLLTTDLRKNGLSDAILC